MSRSFCFGMALLIALGVSTFGCGVPRSAPTFGINFRVVSDDGSVLSGVSIKARGHTVGTTNQKGELDIDLAGSEGESVPIDVQCASEYRSPARSSSLKLTRTRHLANGTGTPRIPYVASCTRKQRNVVIVARGEHVAGIPVTVEGKPVALTDANGNAQVLIPLDADVTLLRVGFETTARPELVPKNPGRVCDVRSGDDLILLEQKFSVAPKPALRRLQPRPKRVPVRLE